MIKLNYFLEKIKDVKPADYLSLFPMTAALILRPFFIKKFKNTWLVCEEPFEARDNGYRFFKYMCENQPQQKCFYAIKKDSVDYKKVKNLGEVIEHGSIKHWLAYFLCRYNISSQKGGKPNAAVCSFMELNGRFKPKNVFLQHGIIINDLEWLYADRSCIKYFITSTIPEAKFIDSRFGYPRGTVRLTGMPRLDNLHDVKISPRRILIMPTWRYWFNLKSKQNENTDSNFETSEYLEKWLEILSCQKMKDLIKKHNLDVVFYPHRNMQNHIDIFKKIDSPVTVASWEDYDIQELLKSSEMMITDYSSVFFDMVYMKKPVIFYQFDEEKFRANQYAEGYFDYNSTPFGKSFKNCSDVLSELENIINSDFKVSDSYLAEHKKIFKYWDSKNSERIFLMLSGGNKGRK